MKAWSRDALLDQAFNNGLKAYSEGNFQDAFRHFRVAADFGRGSPESMYRLSNMYLFGEGTEKSIEQGMSGLKDAANRGYVPAILDLGLRSLRGHEVEKNLALAKKCFSNFVQDPKWRYHLGIVKYESKDRLEKIDGIKLIISAAEDGYDRAKTIDITLLREELNYLLAKNKILN